MKKTFLLTIAFILTLNFVFGQTSTLKGVVINSKTSEKVPHCAVHLYNQNDTNKYVVFTDINGCFSFNTIKKSKYKLRVGFPDYFDSIKKIKVNKDTINVKLYVKQKPPIVCY